MFNLHPLVRMLASRPELLADHAAAYLELAAVEAGQAAMALRRRALLATVAVVLGATGVGAACVAALLAAAVPAAQMPAAWVLPALPLALLLGAAASWFGQRRLGIDLGFALTRGQLALDRQAFSGSQGT